MSGAETPAYRRLREELMRVGLMAVSERQDGCINKTTALQIREIVYRACWPEDCAAPPPPRPRLDKPPAKEIRS